MKQGFVEVEEARLFYQIHGEGGRDIVWVHGLPLNSNSWYAQFQYFKSGFRHIALDLRGYGQSSPLPSDVKSVTDLYVSDLLALFDTLSLNKPILVGFASGGHGTIRFAAEHSDLISQLILINASPCFMKQDGWDWGFDQATLDGIINDITQAPSLEALSTLIFNPAMNETAGADMTRLRAWFDTMLSTAPKETLLAFFNNIAYDDDRSCLKNITVPSLILSSTLGKEVPSEMGVYIREHIPQAQLVELNGVDHFAFAAQSQLVNQVIEQFIQPSCHIRIPEE